MKSKSLVIDAPFKLGKITSYAMGMYDNFNKEKFDEEPIGYVDVMVIVYNFHSQGCRTMTDVNIPRVSVPDGSSDVVLCYSGGLDSTYQALSLKEKGFRVHLLHVKGLNTYENSNSTVCARDCAEKMGMDYTEVLVKKVKEGLYKSFWPENPVKNQLLEAIATDLCIERGYGKISLGDDKTRFLENAIMGVNLTDAKEVGDAMENELKLIVKGLEFVSISGDDRKHMRLRKLEEYGLLDSFYSCVSSGRFNQFYHKKEEEKYGITLRKHNCGSMCRKCAVQNLLYHYYGFETFPQEFIDACWKRLWNNSCAVNLDLFGKDIPLEERIRNLGEPYGD